MNKLAELWVISRKNEEDIYGLIVDDYTGDIDSDDEHELDEARDHARELALRMNDDIYAHVQKGEELQLYTRWWLIDNHKFWDRNYDRNSLRYSSSY